jgi:hypothetical protein
MIAGLKPMGAAEAALRLMARRGRGDWMALVVEPGADVPSAATELAEEMETLGDSAVERVSGAVDAEDLATCIATRRGPVVLSGLDGWPAPEWGHFDRLRSRFAREERTDRTPGPLLERRARVARAPAQGLATIPSHPASDRRLRRVGGRGEGAPRASRIGASQA